MNARAFTVALLALTACRIPQAYVYNLQEVREPDGSVKRIGAPMAAHEWFVRTQILASLGSENVDLTRDPEVIEDPDGVALENLIDLARCDPTDPQVLALQVEMLTWLAVEDDYVLARERAVIALGPIGVRLGVETPEQIGADLDPAGPDDLVGPLAELVRQVRALLEHGDDPNQAVAAACAQLDSLLLDRNGARRMVAATRGLLRLTGYENPAMAPVRALHLKSARRAVGLALGQALMDRSDHVRAAAITSGTRLTGNGLANLRLRALDETNEPLLLAVLDGLARHGIPSPAAGLSPAQLRDWEVAFLSRLVTLTRDLRGPVSMAACQALGAVSGSGMQSLRWEVWTRWWDDRVRASDAGLPAENLGP